MDGHGQLLRTFQEEEIEWRRYFLLHLGFFCKLRTTSMLILDVVGLDSVELLVLHRTCGLRSTSSSRDLFLQRDEASILKI